ncbi:heme ABC transporter ATP-binding protein [Halolamina sp.]|jgi:iron complex transport system ATP-binding protein|uniref:heme ABC transporter ATP-binding protein n=1 Tax=Halolamina sp. TaxID=1940283 RepID=UPI000223B895|nr:Iron-chelate-transporting ATPase [halophilic archaeon DL31]
MSHEIPVHQTVPVDEPVLEVSDLAVSLGETTILEGVNLTVGAGELVGLVGPNGAGKTTLLRAIRGTLTPDSGEIRVTGETMQDLSSKAASRRVATVPQETSLAFEFSVRETVEMGRTPHLSRFGGMADADFDAVSRAMERTDVMEFADRPVTDISGGERSRVLLARALAQATPLLLLDEPTASLDLNHQLATFDTVADLVGSGRGAVAAIHDLNLAARYCDRLVVVANGGVLADGPPEQVLTEDILHEGFDADAVVTSDPVTERPHVTALSANSEAPQADGGIVFDYAAGLGRAHVVAGGGRAGPLLSALDRAGVEITVGPVAEGDTDAEVAAALEVETVRIGPLSGVDVESRERTTELAAAADAVVVADIDLTAGLVPVFDAVAEAGVRVLCVEERPLEERIRSERAADRYRSLREQGAAIAPADLHESLR